MKTIAKRRPHDILHQAEIFLKRYIIRKLIIALLRKHLYFHIFLNYFWLIEALAFLLFTLQWSICEFRGSGLVLFGGFFEVKKRILFIMEWLHACNFTFDTI